MRSAGEWSVLSASANEIKMKHPRVCHDANGVLGLLALASCLLSAGCGREPSAKLSFNESIQPILSENCYGCHGPSSSSRKAGLRLDRAENAYAPHEKFGPAIIPGKPDKSPLVHRIEAASADERMPPPEAHKTLKPEQIALLRRWVQEGAHYEPHWAFIAPQRPPLPESATASGKQWARNGIDRFILARLEAEHLTPSPEADKRSLIRRVTYDLTGLPPSPQEVDAFLADAAPDAYEKVVDHLLQSPRYGEHRAHYWLDYVRYADTHGIHFDNYRAIWPYRDYVIRAYNANKPFDRFVREQLAGDLLPEQNLDSLVATGYMRSNLTTNEGGDIPEEVFVNLTRDRVETFGVTFLGLTTGCAVCHDHKFDPTSQKDTYQLAAFLNNTADGPMDFNTPDPPPVLRFPDEQNLSAFDQMVRERGRLQQQLRVRRIEAPDLLRAQLAAGHLPQAVSTDGLELRLRFDEGKGNVVKNSAPHAALAQFESDTNPIIWGESNWLWPGARFDGGTRLPLGKVGDVETNEAFSVGGWFMFRATAQDKGAVLARMGDPDGPNKSGWAIFYRPIRYHTGLNAYPGGHIVVALANDSALSRPEPKPAPKVVPDTKKKRDPLEAFRIAPPPPFNPMKRAIEVQTHDNVPSEQWVHLFVTYDGSGKAGGVRVYVDGRLAAAEIMNDSLRPGDSIRTGATTYLGRRDNDQLLRETRFQDIRWFRRALSETEVGRLPYEDYAAEIVARQSDPAKWNDDEAFVVLDRYYLGQQDQTAQRLTASIADLQTQMDALAPAPQAKPGFTDTRTLILPGISAASVLQKLIDARPSTLIAQERASPAYAYTLKRGDYASRLERVGPDTPHFLPPLAAGVPRDRLALANWLFTAQNPLFARVAVNRMWQEVFGTGIVETAGDFGVMGERPSNQKLLDWLAVEFRESGWDVKRMYRLMLLSATYRQSAGVTPELLRADPANRLLARGPRFRMDAEEVRDSALAVSGLLVEKIGGPPVKPYAPPGLWQEVAMPESNTKEYVADTGEGLYRRSVYSFTKRASPQPSMETFDATSRETVCPRRARADTPLQALVTLNDPEFIEAARVLAQNALRARPDAAATMDTLSRATLGRPLDPEEQAILEQSRQAFVQRFEAQPANAKLLLAVGAAPMKPSLNPRELATWTMVASELLNLDEFLTK
jgi:hypothetical protein